MSPPGPPLHPTESENTVFPRSFGDRFVLLKELGHGGMGKVFMASSGQAGVERLCALKVIRDVGEGERETELGTRFQDEARVVTRLTHENLVYVFDYGVAQGAQGYLAMEFVEGRTLTEVWNRCAKRGVGFPFGVSMYLISELVAGLAYAHRTGDMGLVHRDVSPSNVMLSFTGGVKLIDFGLAKWKSKVAQTATGVNWGKVSYMSPEQYLGRPIDKRSDLYAAALILWELLTGRQMFPSNEPRAHEPKPVPPSQINGQPFAELDAVMGKALAINPADRYQTGEDFSAALVGLLPREAGKLALSQFLGGLFPIERDAEAAERDALMEASALFRTQRGGAQPKPDGVRPKSSDPLIGETLEGRYYVRKKVGEGAMGRVYEGHHTGLGKRVAIKIPRRPERRRSELIQRFQLEAMAASQIGHPNIADVSDCGTTTTGDFFFVMEFVDGVDLDHLIRREGTLDPRRVLPIAIQVCRALGAAHKAGIIHRDLKPSNVMIVRGREEVDMVKVLDFGVAKFLRGDPKGGDAVDLTRTNAAVGTPRYMAPEQIEGGGGVDFRADIYALGGLIYFMLSGGQAPIEGDTVRTVCRRKLNEDPTPLSQVQAGLPAELEALVMRCLSRVPNDRPSTMDDLRTALLALLTGLGGELAPPSDPVLPVVLPALPPALALLPAAQIPPRRVEPEPANLSTPVVTSPSLTPRPGSATALVTGETQIRQRVRRRALGVAGLAAGALTALGLVAMVQRLDNGAEQAAPLPVVEVAPARVPVLVPEPVASVVPALAPATSIVAVKTPAPTGVAVRPATVGRRDPGPRAPTPVVSQGLPKNPAVTPDPDRVRRLLEKAENVFQEGHHPEALALAQNALAAGGGAAAWNFMGKVYRNTERPEEALGAYGQALKLDPGNAVAKHGKTLLQSALKH